MKRLLLILTLTIGTIQAQEPPVRGGERGGGPMKGRMLDRIKAQDPDAYAELERLRREDPEKFREEMRKRFGQQFTRGGGGGGEKGARPDNQFARGDKPGKGGMHGRRGPRGEEFMQRLFERMDQKDPEQAAELRRLHQEDPEAFREKVREILTRRPGMHPQGKPRGPGGPAGDKMQRLRERFNNAGSEAERQAVREETREVLAKHFDGEVDKQQERLEAMAKQIELMRERLAERKEQRDTLLDEQLGKVLEGEE